MPASQAADDIEGLLSLDRDAPANSNATERSPSHTGFPPVGGVGVSLQQQRRRAGARVDYLKLSQGEGSSDSGDVQPDLELVFDGEHILETIGRASKKRRSRPKTGSKGAPAPQQTVLAVTQSAPPTQMDERALSQEVAQSPFGINVELRDAVARGQALRSGGACSCAVLNVLTKADLKIACKLILRNPGAISQLSKGALLARCCVSCENADDAKAATKKLKDAATQGIHPEFWNWPVLDDSRLSILDAFHQAMMNRVQDPACAAFSAALNEFRAHLMSHFVTNYGWYITKGRVCRINGPGHAIVHGPAERVLNFAESCRACLRHYNNQHDGQTCGLIRKGLNCMPFQVFGDFPAELRIICTRFVHRFVQAFGHASQCPIRDPYPNQILLRQIFELQ